MTFLFQEDITKLEQIIRGGIRYERLFWQV